MIEEKLAIVTGASRETGLGFETAKQLTELGYRVIVTARNVDSLAALADQIGAIARPLDITDDKSVQQFAQEVEQQFGKLDALVNNAGAYFDAGQQPLSAEMDFVKDAFDANLLGAWRMIKAFVPLLEKSGHGRIVNVSSGAGSFTDPVFGLPHHPNGVPVYALTKLALNGLTVKLAKQLEGSTIKINAVCPGFVATYPGTAEWGARPVQEGAKSIVWGVTLPDDGPSGGFFRDGQPIAW
ncbi:SDR family NAD(P)-dependent oxidoreductase [Larkinella sp. VNQ87]|uniref:SDR family NAD(P)-dependent oxidoreductase n=1 Tax=Larkinella sp. VNQ87 TaxID=3400921 RepID=UPI003BFF7263